MASRWAAARATTPRTKVRELSADRDVSGRDAGIPGWRVAQWGPAHGQRGGGAFAPNLPGSAGVRATDLRPSGFRVLLLGSGGRLSGTWLPIRDRGPQNRA